MNPHQYESENNARSYCRARNNNHIGNLCATLVTSNLTTAAPKALINGMVGIHIYRKEGRIECLFDLQCHQLTKILEPQGTGGAQKRPLTDFFCSHIADSKGCQNSQAQFFIYWSRIHHLPNRPSHLHIRSLHRNQNTTLLLREMASEDCVLSLRIS